MLLLPSIIIMVKMPTDCFLCLSNFLFNYFVGVAALCLRNDMPSLSHQKFWGSFVFPWFDLHSDIKLGGGVNNVPKVLRPFCLNIWYIFEFRAYKKLFHGCLKFAEPKVTLRMSKMRGGGLGHFWTLSKRKTLSYDPFPDCGAIGRFIKTAGSAPCFLRCLCDVRLLHIR